MGGCGDDPFHVFRVYEDAGFDAVPGFRLEIVVVRLDTVLRMEDDVICNHRSLLAIHGHHKYCCRDNGDNRHSDDGESFPPRDIM